MIKKLLLIFMVLWALLLTGCYDTITGYELVGEYPCPSPLGYWGGSKLSYDQNGGLKLSVALGKSEHPELSKTQPKAVKLSGKTEFVIEKFIYQEPWTDFTNLNPDKLTISEVLKQAPFLLRIYSGQIHPCFCPIFDQSQLKSLAVFTKNSYLQILNPQSLSIEKEMKVETNIRDFVSKIACSYDLQYLAIGSRGIEPFDHTIEIYKLNQESNTYQFYNRFDKHSKHHRKMFFSDMTINNDMLVINLQTGARSTIKTSKIVFYNLKKDFIESVYFSKNISFVNSAAVTPDLEYLIIVGEPLKLYRRITKNSGDNK